MSFKNIMKNALRDYLDEVLTELSYDCKRINGMANWLASTNDKIGILESAFEQYKIDANKMQVLENKFEVEKRDLNNRLKVLENKKSIKPSQISIPTKVAKESKEETGNCKRIVVGEHKEHTHYFKNNDDNGWKE